MNEKELFSECTNLTSSIEDAIELYKVRQALPINFTQPVIKPFSITDDTTITLSYKDIDIELLDIALSTLGRGECFISKVKIFDVPESMKDFIEWFIKFMYYQESTGNLQVDEVKEVFTSKFCEFPLQDKTVKNKIEVLFL